MTYLLAIPTTLYVFWLLFIVYAAVSNNWAKLGLPQKILLGWLIVPFGALDVMVNLTLGSLMFWQAPTLKTLTLTRRIEAIKKAPPTWRTPIAIYVCGNMCDVFQQGHC